jgi:hypothetical protein
MIPIKKQKKYGKFEKRENDGKVSSIHATHAIIVLSPPN